MIKFTDVTKRFGETIALDKISFEVKNGEMVFITGPSGAGKSTLLKLILQDLKPDSGKIEIDGKDTSQLDKNDLPKFRQKIGCVFQDFKLFNERTARENIEIALGVIGAPEGEWDARVNHVLKLVGLTKRADFFPAQLSGGEIQRVSLARALVINPSFILADEPTGNLDWNRATQIVDLLSKINSEGKTILIATHNEQIVKASKKRVIEIENGRIKDGKK